MTGSTLKNYIFDNELRVKSLGPDNYQGTPEQIARRSSRNQARRIMGDKAVQGLDVGHRDNNPLNNDPSNLKMEDPSKNRREPRLREEPKKITKTKQAKGDVADVKGTQPAKYYSKDTEGDEMSKSTKIARARHFAKGGSRDKAPGDTGATTKPSQYSKKYKQKFLTIFEELFSKPLSAFNFHMKFWWEIQTGLLPILLVVTSASGI